MFVFISQQYSNIYQRDDKSYYQITLYATLCFFLLFYIMARVVELPKILSQIVSFVSIIDESNFNGRLINLFRLVFVGGSEHAAIELTHQSY